MTKDWVTFNPLKQVYETCDGTAVAAELVDTVNCLADIITVCHIRETQRDEKRAI